MAIGSISERSILCSIRIVRVTTLTPSNIVWNRLAVVSTTKRVHVHAYIKSLIHTEGGCYPYLPLFLYLRFTYACSFVCISSCGLLPDFFLTSSHAVVFFPCFFLSCSVLFAVRVDMCIPFWASYHLFICLLFL